MTPGAVPPIPAVRARLDKARAARLARDFFAAEDAARDAARRAPRRPEAWTELGAILSEQGRRAEALAAFTAALDCAPTSATALSNHANALWLMGRSAQAEAGFRRALTRSPRLVAALVGLGIVRFDAGALAEAAALFERALAVAPDAGKIRLFLGLTRDLLGDAAAAAKCFAPFYRAPGLPGPQLDSWHYVKARLADDTGRDAALPACALRTLDHALAAAPAEGLVMEFGVLFGHSLTYLAGKVEGEVHGFDSFAGLPEDWGPDRPKGSYSTAKRLPPVPDNARLHVGWITDTLPPFLAAHPGPARLVNIDVDLYSSTRDALEGLGGRIGAGTVLVFDEYLFNDSWRADEYKAWSEFTAARGLTYRYLAFNPFSKQAVVRVESAFRSIGIANRSGPKARPRPRVRA